MKPREFELLFRSAPSVNRNQPNDLTASGA
jgi:hypothetical protein